MNTRTYRVGAVMVLYKPDWNVSGEAIRALAPQVDVLCIVDNTPDSESSTRFIDYDNVRYIPLMNNMGIAAAQNTGIRLLMDMDVQFILFSDQDSVPQNNLVDGLVHDLVNLRDKGFNAGLIGPVPINKVTGLPYKSKIRSVCEVICGEQSFDECQYLISSYSLVIKDCFKQVGLFREELFVDFVDNEWCFRLRARTGLSPYISRRLSVLHELGKSQKFLGKQINVSSPFRLYYQIRNYFWIRNLDYIPDDWIKQVRNKLIPKLIYYPIIPRQRFSYLKSILRGLRDGLKKRTSMG